MTLLRSLVCIGPWGMMETGCSRGALPASSVCAHPHIPRYRSSVRPLRASGGKDSPRPARRRISYWDAIRQDGVAPDRVTLKELVAAFFLLGRLARASGGGYRNRTSALLTSRAPVPGPARPARAVPRETPEPRPEACAAREGRASWAPAPRSLPLRGSPWLGRKLAEKPHTLLRHP